VYWATALNIYDQSPTLGVGLGNYAFYFPEMLPNQPYDEQREIMRQITPGEGRDRLITPKNLYARLIAETGLLGTVLFTTFFLAVIGCVLFLWFSPSPEQKYWAMSGFLSLVVFFVVVFSFDSFSIPNMWVVFGLITAAAHLADPPAG
jgi:O-antigen ligase